MKPISLTILLLAAGAATGADTPPSPPTWEPGHFSLLPRSLQRTPYLDVMIVTEDTPAGRRAPQASPAHPVYYTGSDGGIVTVGEEIGGEVPPPASELARILVQALALGGFQPRDAAHPPTIFIHYRWGSYNKLQPLPGPPDDLDIENLLERASLVGGTAFALRMAEAMNAGTMHFFENSDPRTQFLVQEARDNRYFIIASAYDYAAATQGRVVLLWQTRISTNSQGVMMNESLPQLAASAGPYFGHETGGAVRLSRPTVPEGHVSVGTPVVKETLPPDEPAANPGR